MRGPQSRPLKKRDSSGFHVNLQEGVAGLTNVVPVAICSCYFADTLGDEACDS